MLRLRGHGRAREHQPRAPGRDDHRDRPALGLLLLPSPLATVFFAYRAYVSEREKSERLQHLYELSRILQLLTGAGLGDARPARPRPERCSTPSRVDLILFPGPAADAAP